MDRKIDRKIRIREKRNLYLKAGGLILICAMLVIGLGVFMQPSINAKDASFSRADIGDIQITTPAYGKIVVAFEEIINSPITSRILEVYKNTGDSLTTGMPILRLDLQSTETVLKQMEDERQMKELQLKQLRLQNRNKLAEMQLNLKVMEMELARKKLEMQNEMYLDSLGASTKDKVNRAQLNYEVNRLELEEQSEKYKNMLELRDADESVKKLELEIFRKEILEKQRTLQDAQIRSPRKAVLSYVNTEIGTQVHAGTKIAVITEPGSYKVEGEIADSYAAKLAPGNEVIVLIDQKPLQGIVSQVAPLSKSGMISFTVKLADESNPLLRAGMRADIYIVNACRTDVVRIRNSGFYTKPGSYDLFVVSGDQLVRREVQLGDCNYDFIEVKSGLDPGEIVLVNNFEKYLSNTKMKLKNMKTIRI